MAFKVFDPDKKVENLYTKVAEPMWSGDTGNITAFYTVIQVKKIIKSINKNSKTIISIFAGRIADTGNSPIENIKYGVGRFRNKNIC